MGCASSTLAPATDPRRLQAEGPAFEMSTPMLVMPFLTFKEQKRIFKSIKSWRDDALASGRLVRFAWVEGGTGKVVDGALDGTIIVAQGKVAIFISHTCVCRF